MKLIGLIGGLGWLSTIDYYRLINQGINERIGGTHAAKILLYSIDFGEFSGMAKRSAWQEIAELLSKIAKGLETAGAECILLCANTPHIVAGRVQDCISVPVIDIAISTATEILSQGIHTVALLGSKATMEQDFFVKKLTERRLKVIIPDPDEREYLDNLIFNELAKGDFNATARERFTGIVGTLINNGCEGIILGCTEFSYLINGTEISVPLFDTAKIHANAAVKFSLNL